MFILQSTDTYVHASYTKDVMSKVVACAGNAIFDQDVEHCSWS